jgi:hydroxylaminobenzene mutase
MSQLTETDVRSQQMERADSLQATADSLVRLGYVLFLLGLLAGFAVPLVANPRMGLASHMQGLLNGMFLIALGLVWMKLQLGATGRRVAWALAIYGTFANWTATLLAAIWGAGRSMPIAAGGRVGTPVQEMVVDGLLYSLSLAMVVLTAMAIWGLRGRRSATAERAA